MRHVSRTHRVDLDWLFDKINTMQIEDIPTKRCFIRERWVKLITLLMMMTPSENVCSRVPNDMNLQRLQARCERAALNWPLGNRGCPRKNKIGQASNPRRRGSFLAVKRTLTSRVKGKLKSDEALAQADKCKIATQPDSLQLPKTKTGKTFVIFRESSTSSNSDCVSSWNSNTPSIVRCVWCGCALNSLRSRCVSS